MYYYKIKIADGPIVGLKAEDPPTLIETYRYLRINDIIKEPGSIDEMEEIPSNEVSKAEAQFNLVSPFTYNKLKRNSLAQRIADYMTETGTSKTWSGNYHFEFDEINKLFGVNLPDDRDLLEKIENEFDYEIVADATIDDDFDLLFWLAFCRYAED